VRPAKAAKRETVYAGYRQWTTERAYLAEANIIQHEDVRRGRGRCVGSVAMRLMASRTAAATDAFDVRMAFSTSSIPERS
jgi:hypothetical protein